MPIKFLTPLQLSIGVKTMVIGAERDEAQLHIKEQVGIFSWGGGGVCGWKIIKSKGNSC